MDQSSYPLLQKSEKASRRMWALQNFRNRRGESTLERRDSLSAVHIKEDAAGAFLLYILPPTNATETTINTTRDNQHHKNQFLTFAKHKQLHMWLFFNHCKAVSHWQHILTKIGGIIVSYSINFPYFSSFSDLLL